MGARCDGHVTGGSRILAADDIVYMHTSMDKASQMWRAQHLALSSRDHGSLALQLAAMAWPMGAVFRVWRGSDAPESRQDCATWPCPMPGRPRRAHGGLACRMQGRLEARGERRRALYTPNAGLAAAMRNSLSSELSSTCRGATQCHCQRTDLENEILGTF